MLSLVAPHRIFLLEGSVTMHKRLVVPLGPSALTTVQICSSLQTDRHLLLFSDILLIAKRHHIGKPLSSSLSSSFSPSTHLQEELHLSQNHCGATPLQEEEGLECKTQLMLKELEDVTEWDMSNIGSTGKFAFKVMAPLKTFYLEVDTQEQQTKWINELKHAIENAKNAKA